MDSLLLTADERSLFGKEVAVKLRRAGKIPAVVYGGSAGSRSIVLEERDFLQKFRYMSENTIVPMQLGSSKINVMVKEYQHDIVRDKILHVDFYEITMNKTVKVAVPIHLIGSAIGQREGGVAEQALHEVEVECMPRFIPKHIDVDISALKVGDSLHVSNLKKIENVTFITHSNETIVALSYEKGSMGEAASVEEAPVPGAKK